MQKKIKDYKSLQKEKKRIKTEITNQEEQTQNIASALFTIVKAFKTQRGSSKKESAGLISTLLSGVMMPLALKPNSKAIVYSVTTAAGLFLASFVGKRINRFLQKITTESTKKLDSE